MRGFAAHCRVVARIALTARCYRPPPPRARALDLLTCRTLKTDDSVSKMNKQTSTSACLSVELCRSRRIIAVAQSNHVISLWSMDAFSLIGALPCHSNPQVMCWYVVATAVVPVAAAVTVAAAMTSRAV